MAHEINEVQDNEFSEKFTWVTTDGPKFEELPSSCKLKVESSDNGFRLKGRVTKPDTYTITITQTKTATVTINIVDKKSFMELGMTEALINMFTGRRPPKP